MMYPRARVVPCGRKIKYLREKGPSHDLTTGYTHSRGFSKAISRIEQPILKTITGAVSGRLKRAGLYPARGSDVAMKFVTAPGQ